MAAIKVGRVNRVIDQFGLGFVLALHRVEATLFFQPLAHQIQNVYAPGVRRVVERFVFHVRVVVEHCRQPFTHARQKIFPNDDDSHAAGAHVLLCARIDQAVFIHRDWLGQDI